MSKDAQQPEYLILGEVLRPHGVRGEVRMRILTAYPERLASIETVFLGEDPMQPRATAYKLEQVRMHQNYGLLKLAGIDDRNQAERLRALYVMTTLDQAVPLEEDEFYLYELIGMTVKTEDGQTLGTLREVLETGANDVYIIDSPHYGEVLIPVLDDIILKTDNDQGVLTVRLPQGLLPDSPAEDA
ncbi:MAG: 16S rRNA processing protein RimM [Chloroflexi bacterium]|nr:16S rRNA processing protein RimM [Chloroflexota bacterium]